MTKLSDYKKLTEAVNLGLIAEETSHALREDSLGGDRYQKAQLRLLKSIKAIGQTNDPAFILSIEKNILKNELRIYGNSPGMKGSLNAAIDDMTSAEKLIAVVQDPVAYKTVDESHSRPRSRTKGVPRDEARKSISSQYTRLLNMDRSRLTETEKQTAKARRNNLRKAEKAYIAMQHQALGLTPPGKSRERGLER